MMKRLLLIPVLAAMLLFGACATNKAYRQGQRAELDKDWDRAVVHYTQALERDPDDLEIRLRLESAKRMASTKHVIAGRELWAQERWEEALVELRTAVELNPFNRQARFELAERLEEVARRQEALREQEEWERMRAAEQAALEADAEQRPAIDIEAEKLQDYVFPDREIAEIYQALARMADINIIFHESIQRNLRQKTDFIVYQSNFWDAFDFFVTANNHFYRMINDRTILVIDGSTANRRTYEDKAVKIFYLSNSDVQEVFTAVRAVLRIATISRLQEQNAIVVRETPQKLAIVAKLIEILDKPKAEVIIDIEILEVETSLMTDIGTLLSTYSVAQMFYNPDESIPIEGGGAVRLNNLGAINSANYYLTIPDIAYHFLKTSGRAQLIAKPQLRITDGAQSTLHIGERVPVRSTTFNPNQAAGIGIPVDAYNYENVGIKFDLTPHVHHNMEVSIELNIDISAVGAGGTTTNPSFTTRNVQGQLRLRDGETNLLAGLIKEEEKTSFEGIPGLGDIPIIGRLFSKTRHDNRKTDIIITITPHIVRGSQITIEDLHALMVGPEINTGYEGTISMEEIYNLRFLRGVPMRGGRVRADDFDEDDFDEYEEDEER